MGQWNRVAWDAERLIARAEIEDLLLRWNEVISDRIWDQYEELFAPDNSIDFSSIGSQGTDAASHRDFLRDIASGFTSTEHHLLGSPVFLELERDTARTSTHCLTIARMAGGALFVVGVIYHDWLVRTEDGWRIKRKECQRVFTEPDSDI